MDPEELKKQKAKNHLWFLFQFLHEEEKKLSKEREKQVMIEKAINLKLMCDYVVSCSYGDIVLIICMLHDYVKMLDEVRSDIQREAYYREKFIKMADRLSEQIEYDYEAAVEKCRKKSGQKERVDDVDEDALYLAVNQGKGKRGDKKE
ncbi:MAG: hypothetical protein LUH14_01125 [Clostridiaceae bacterium]|nr:hypothetical protein [Clostridiaceae bacterium]